MSNSIEDKNRGVSISVPFLNEEDGILLFCDSMDEKAAYLNFPIELVFVDDGSTDRTVELLSEYKFKHIESVKIVRFSKNFGSHAAVRAGVMNSYYDICTWMGCDLQEPFELIPEGYQKIKEGFDAVYIDKKTIKIAKSNRLFSKVYSYLMRKYAVSNYSSGGTSTIVFNGKIKRLLNDNVESNSSIHLQIMDAGFKYVVLSMAFNERSTGVSRWTLSKKVKLFIDSFVAFSFMPIRLVSVVGITMFALGILVGVITIVNKLISPMVPVGYSTLICILSLGFGVTNISLGIIAEYLWRTYDAARKRPAFIISEIFSLK